MYTEQIDAKFNTIHNDNNITKGNGKGKEKKSQLTEKEAQALESEVEARLNFDLLMRQTNKDKYPAQVDIPELKKLLEFELRDELFSTKKKKKEVVDQILKPWPRRILT